MRIYMPYQIAEKLGVHEQTVRRWIRKGELKSTKISKRGDSRISQEQLDTYLKELNP